MQERKMYLRMFEPEVFEKKLKKEYLQTNCSWKPLMRGKGMFTVFAVSLGCAEIFAEQTGKVEHFVVMYFALLCVGRVLCTYLKDKVQYIEGIQY